MGIHGASAAAYCMHSFAEHAVTFVSTNCCRSKSGSAAGSSLRTSVNATKKEKLVRLLAHEVLLELQRAFVFQWQDQYGILMGCSNDGLEAGTCETPALPTTSLILCMYQLL